MDSGQELAVYFSVVGGAVTGVHPTKEDVA
jgi:hypothetical protein